MFANGGRDNRCHNATMREATDPLGAVRDAIAAGAWDVAVSGLESLGQIAGSADGLELTALARYGAGDFEGAVAAWEELHARQLAACDLPGAARAAAMVAMYLMMDTGLMSPVRGWLRRAERLLDGFAETPAHALLEMVRTYERFMSGDSEEAGASARRAVDLGLRHGVQPAVVIGRTALARLEIFAGRVEQGLDQLDDIAVTLLAGEVDPLTTGMALCELICAMQGLALYDRAGEWTMAMEHWRQGTAFGGINGRCRVHRAEMLRLSGPCDQAEEEALRACEELRPWMRREFGWPLAELGNIRLRKGDLGGAEEAFVAAHEHAWTPQPGLALLRLAQGDVVAATALIADALEHPFDTPSKERPPFGLLRRAPLLDAQAEIAAAAGDAATVRAAADELREIADGFPSVALAASASLAQGRACLAECRPADAIGFCERALVAWTEIGAPFEAAVARMVLGQACTEVGNSTSAALEWRAAQTAFAEYGAARWAERAAHWIDGLPGTVSPSPTPVEVSELSVFTCDGTVRSVRFDGVTVMLADLKGLRYLSRLLAEPGREFHVLDLVAAESGGLPTIRSAIDPTLVTSHGDAGFVLDDRARDAYRRRLLEVDDDIAEATAMNDFGRVALAQSDRAFLVQELARAFGLGGRHRRTGETSERARTAVARSLRYSIARLAEHHPGLGRHLEQAVRTGTYCSYAPDPRLAIAWKV